MSKRSIFHSHCLFLIQFLQHVVSAICISYVLVCSFSVQIAFVSMGCYVVVFRQRQYFQNLSYETYFLLGFYSAVCQSNFVFIFCKLPLFLPTVFFFISNLPHYFCVFLLLPQFATYFISEVCFFFAF